MKYVYPAVFTPEDGCYIVKFPDLENCYTDGENITEALINAEDVLNLMLWHMEEKSEAIPAPSNPKKIPCSETSFVSLVAADTLKYRKLHDTKSVKKTLSIPRWLDAMARNKNINFSKALQNALIAELDIESR
jgi:predicted RNase H-like HicB family nuclease